MISAAPGYWQIVCFALGLRDQRPWVSPDSLPGATSVWRKCIKDPHEGSYFNLLYTTKLLNCTFVSVLESR